MNLCWTPDAWSQYIYWQTQDKKILKRINALLKDVMRSPYEGIGNPEALKHELSGCWSRRITQEHRLVYEITDTEDEIYVIQCRGHY